MKSTTKIIIFFICVSLIAFKWWHFVKKANSPQPIQKLDLVEQVKEENQKLINKRAEEEQQREAQKKPISREALNNLIDTLIALEDENNLNQFECTSNELIKNSLVRYINRQKKYNTTINEEQKKIDDLNQKIKEVKDKQRPLQIKYDNDTPEFERLQLKDDNDTLTTTEKNRYNTLFNERTQLEIEIADLEADYNGLQDIKQRTEDLKQYFVNQKNKTLSQEKQFLLENEFLKLYYRIE